MKEISKNELLYINGGVLEKPSDYFLLAGGIAACFVNPSLGIILCITVAIVD